MQIIKETKGNGTLTFKEVSRDLAKEMIVNNHYSKKWNSSFGTLNIGVYKGGKLLGVAVFGNLMNPSSYKSTHPDFVKGSMIELNRLWIDDCLGKNAETTLLGACFKMIKSLRPEVKAIQSFADGRLGCGTIYKAANFNYYGFEHRDNFYEHVDSGEVIHRVNFENTKRPNGVFKSFRYLLDGKLSLFKAKNYKYVYWLNKKMQKDSCKPSLPYPPYEKGKTDVVYKKSLPLLTRAYMMFTAIGDTKYAEMMYNFILEEFSECELDNTQLLQAENKSYQWFLEEYVPKNKLK